MATTMERLGGSGMPSDQALRVMEEVSEAALLRDWMLQTFATKIDLAGVRTELAEVKADLVKWMAGFWLTTIGLTLAGVYFLLAHFKG